MSQLIEINDRYYQEAEIIMLATKYGKITLYDYDNLKTLSLAQGNHKGTKNTIRPQHLYILSNEEIKESDWYMVTDFSKLEDIKQAVKDITAEEKRHNGFKKIIATTDKSIGYTDIRVSPVKNFCIYPQPSDSFIKKYIEEYNKGNIITNVLVEYRKATYEDWIKTAEPVKDSVKVDSNNCITIKKVEPELYTREEVKILLQKSLLFAFKEGNNHIGSNLPFLRTTMDNWIKQNL